MSQLLGLLLTLNVHTVVLSFDDGPDANYTPVILDILKAHNIKANFFVVGDRIYKYPNVYKRIVSEGHIVGGHSMTHKELTKIPLEQAKHEIMSSMVLVPSRLFRFPYGSHNSELDKFCKEMGYKAIFWDVDTTDWKYPDKEVIFEKFKLRVVKAKDKAIILMHDIHPQTIGALKLIINYIKENNIATEVINE